jgi:hypothetical protein
LIGIERLLAGRVNENFPPLLVDKGEVKRGPARATILVWRKLARDVQQALPYVRDAQGRAVLAGKREFKSAAAGLAFKPLPLLPARRLPVGPCHGTKRTLETSGEVGKALLRAFYPEDKQCGLTGAFYLSLLVMLAGDGASSYAIRAAA